MKKNKLQYSPYSVKRALETSATYLPDVEPFAQGCGLLNVESAYKVLSENSEAIERDVWFSVSCGANNNKGIHLRGKMQDKPRDINVSVEPFFARDFENPEGIWLFI